MGKAFARQALYSPGEGCPALEMFFPTINTTSTFKTAERQTIIVKGVEREYLIKRPPLAESEKQPFTIYLHSGGGKMRIPPESYGLEGLVIAPQGINDT